MRSFLGDTVLAWVTDLGTRKVSPNTIISKLAALSTLADFARRLKNRHGKPLVAENPTKAFGWPDLWHRLLEAGYNESEAEIEYWFVK